ncbi:hypothetical protein [Brevundimonas sp.]|uniref:hypothetical protein n=1 Tax=Brevundimonas sp. TaxID=1871086 RepID=UPI00391D3373
MNKTLAASLMAAAAVSVAVPAAAQNHGPARGGPAAHAPAWQSIAQRKATLDRRIDRAAQNRAISPREANSLRAELNAIVRLETQYRRGGLTRWEMRDLDQRYDRLSARVQAERADNNRRPGGRW